MEGEEGKGAEGAVPAVPAVRRAAANETTAAMARTSKGTGAAVGARVVAAAAGRRRTVAAKGVVDGATRVLANKGENGLHQPEAHARPTPPRRPPHTHARANAAFWLWCALHSGGARPVTASGAVGVKCKGEPSVNVR